MNGHKRKISKTIICFRKQKNHLKSHHTIAILAKKPYNNNKLMNKGVQQ